MRSDDYLHSLNSNLLSHMALKNFGGNYNGTGLADGALEVDEDDDDPKIFTLQRMGC